MANLRIKELCKQKGITQKELAERIGLSPVGLAKAVAGNSTINTLEKIADGLEVNISDLFENSSLNATCPHCGKPLKINIE